MKHQNYDVISYILRNPSSAKSGVKLLEAHLTMCWLDAKSPEPVALSYSSIKKDTGLTVNTVRVAIDDLMASGRWQVIRSAGSTASTYLPLFLHEIPTEAVEIAIPEQSAVVPTPPARASVQPVAPALPEVSVSDVQEARESDIQPVAEPAPHESVPDTDERSVEADHVSAAEPVAIENPEPVEPVIAPQPVPPVPVSIMEAPAPEQHSPVLSSVEGQSKKYESLRDMEDAAAAEELLFTLELILDGREIPKRYAERFLSSMRTKRSYKPEQPFEEFVREAAPPIKQFLSMLM